MKTIEQQIGERLANERGGIFGFVGIWREKGDPLDDGKECYRYCSVGEFLSKEENKKGTWCIDGGWGYPPGPIHVRWNEITMEWENGGFLGCKFEK